MKALRGFAAMSPADRKRIASMGGKAAHEKGTGHEWSSLEAREAGVKGGRHSQRNRKERGLTATGKPMATGKPRTDVSGNEMEE